MTERKSLPLPLPLPQGDRTFTAERMGVADTQKMSGMTTGRVAPDGREFIWYGGRWVSLAVFDAEESEYHLNGFQWR